MMHSFDFTHLHVHLETLHTHTDEHTHARYPIMVAGMAGVTGPALVAAASNCGSIGTIGAIGLSPEGLRTQIRRVQALLNSPDTPFGVDLLLPKTGKNAKKTNKDYVSAHIDDTHTHMCVRLCTISTKFATSPDTH